AVGWKTPEVGEDPARDRPQAKRTEGLCRVAVALDRGANVCVAGPLATTQGGLRMFARNHRGPHSHCDDSAHAAKTGGGMNLFKRALKHCFGQCLVWCLE